MVFPPGWCFLPDPFICRNRTSLSTTSKKLHFWSSVHFHVLYMCLSFIPIEHPSLDPRYSCFVLSLWREESLHRILPPPVPWHDRHRSLETISPEQSDNDVCISYCNITESIVSGWYYWCEGIFTLTYSFKGLESTTSREALWSWWYWVQRFFTLWWNRKLIHEQSSGFQEPALSELLPERRTS